MFGMTVSEVVHESVKADHRLGLMSNARMREFDLMCLSDFKNLPAREIRRARTSNKMSQDLFADCLQVSKHTLQKWEQGKAKPGGAALCLLYLAIDKKSHLHVACRRRHSHEAACLPPVRQFTPNQIKHLRIENRATHWIFAICLNVDVTTVQRWEQGKSKPNGPALRLLNLVADKGLDFLVAHKGPVAPPLNVQKARAGSGKKAKRNSNQKALDQETLDQKALDQETLDQKTRKTRSNPEKPRSDMKAVA